MAYPAGGYRKNSSRNNREGGSQGPSRAFLAPLAGAAPVMPELAKALGYPVAEAAPAGGAVARGALMFGGRLALRFVPIVGAALLAYALLRKGAELFQSYGPWILGDYDFVGTCHEKSGAPHGGIRSGDANICGQMIAAAPPRPVRPGDVFIFFSEFAKANLIGFDSYRFYAQMQRKRHFDPGTGISRAAMAAPEYVQPLPWPSLAPWLLPILQPIPTPQPIPHRVLPDVLPSPNVPAKEQPQVGYGFAPAPSWVFRPPADVWADPANPEQGNPLPEETVTIDLPGVGQVDVPADPNYADPDPDVRTDPSTDVSTEGSTDHNYEKPGQRTKERKFHVTPTAGNFVVALYNMASEVRDFVDALYWALPKNRRLKGHWVQRIDGRWLYVRPSLQAKAMAIYDGINDINMRTAAINLVANQLTDALYGRVGSASRTAAQKVFEQTGYSPSRTQTVSRRGTGGMVSAPDVIRSGVEKAFDQFWPKD